MLKSDDEVVRDVLAGNIDAYADLVDRYYPSLLRLAVHMLGNQEEAEDVVQETFIRAYKGLDRYQSRGRFRSWIYRILMNRCRTVAVRIRQHRERFVSSSLPTTRTSPAASPDDPLLNRNIRLALMQLPVKYREAFLMKYVEGWGYPEIARITRTRVSALKMRVQRAREKLRVLLFEESHDK